MKRSAVVSGVAAGFFLLAPALAFATTPTTGTPIPPNPTSTISLPPSTLDPAPSTTTAHPGNPKAFIHVLPAAAHPGAKVTIRIGCEASYITGLKSSVLEIGKLHQVGPQDYESRAAVSEAEATVKKDAKPGNSVVSFSCGSAALGTKFTVLSDAKQVTKVPAGAPQTGGTDGPVASVEPKSNPAPAVAMGALALGGIGLAAAQRRRSRREQG